MNTTTATRSARLGRWATLTGTVLLAAGVVVPTVAAPAAAATAPAPVVAAGTDQGRAAQDNGHRGVQVEVKNRTKSKVIYVKDRNSGQVKMIPGGTSQTWAEPFKRVQDEVELAAYYDHRVDDPGIELDASNPALGWPTFSVDGDVENFSEDEMKVFNPGDGARYVVTRIGDSDDHKRFVVEVTPPGPIEKAPKPKPAAQEPDTVAATGALGGTTTAAPAAEAHQASQARDDRPAAWTRGTHVGVQNTGDEPVWIQRFFPAGGWGEPTKLAPGEWTDHAGDYAALDDCEMRVFFSAADAAAERDNVDVDAENPSYSTPWMSVDWDSEYFSVGGKHTWITDEGHRFDGERVEDSRHYKEFRLKITPR